MKLIVLALLPLLAFAYDKACTNKDGQPISSKPFRIPNNCDGFYQCSNGYLSSQSCAPGTVFNRKLRVCDHPYNVPECSATKWNKKIICERESEKVSCPGDQVLWVKSASYGRTDADTCPHKKIKDTSCAAAGSLDTIRNHCNGKNSCTVKATNFVFGDPCFGTYKYVEMVYTCRRSPWTKVTVCEHDKQTIKCDDNQEIRVRSGFYGRTNRATCPHPAVLTSSCSAADSFKTIRSACHKKKSCTVHASNSVFGDPCFGTFKYVELSYRCRDLPVIDPCVDKDGNPISSDPFEKPGDCYNFYQCSNGDLYTMPCAPGTAFNPEIGVCDYPYNVPGC